MNKWEYYTMVVNNQVLNIPEILKPMGEDGWELIHFHNRNGTGEIKPESVFIFKRLMRADKLLEGK